jgi:hypothetical protein
MCISSAAYSGPNWPLIPAWTDPSDFGC